MHNLIRRSHSIGRMVVHLSFKIKYCHKVFRYEYFKERCKEIFFEVSKKYNIMILEIGFDLDHVHMIVDIGLHSIVQVCKWFKGNSGYKLLKEFPEIKQKYFWGSGLWAPTKFFDSVGRDYDSISEYVKSQ